jgi:Ca-activated chloride channel family protein
LSGPETAGAPRPFLRAMRLTKLALLAAFLGLFASGRASAIGLLVPTDPGAPPLQLVSHRVEVKITERGAVTHVTQEFNNPTGRPLEATYLFPLPQGASIDELALWMNGKRETGKVMEKQQARAIYESIARRSRDPGLIEYVDAQLFEARVFPVPANGRQKVELTFSNLVDYENGLHRYVYPMKTDQHAAQTLEDFTFTVKIDSKLEIKNLYSPTHEMATSRRGTTALASLEKSNFSLADDLLLYWTVDDADVGLTVLTYKDGDEPGYFMALASPKDKLRDEEIIGKRVAFVVDTSGSMEGEKMEATRRALDQCLAKLGEDDLFSIVSFGGYAEPWKDKMVSASRSNIEAARAWVKKLEPLGGTNIDEALKAAFGSATGSDKAPLMIVFMTDGRPTVGDTDVNAILVHANKEREAKNARIFVLGVGEDLNAVLLDRLSTANGGSALYLKGNAALEAEVASFYEKISHPVLADLKLDVDGVTVFGAHPRALGDLFAGQQLVVIGRYREGGKATVKLTGTTPKDTRTFTSDATFASQSTEHSFIPRLWAQRQVGMLLDEIRLKGESPGLVSEVTQLATRFGIVTPYTSYLVVEPGAGDVPVVRPDLRRIDDAMIPAPTTAAEPPPADGDRDGSFFEGIFGGGGGKGGPAGAPAKSAPRALEDAKTKAREELRQGEGERAVAAAKDIGNLKKSDTVSKNRALTSTMRALGRTFTFADGFFVDEKSSAKDQVLEVKAFSDAFFAALRLRPDLKEALMLAEQVKVSVGKGRTLVVSTKGAEKIDDAKLQGFLKK